MTPYESYADAWQTLASYKPGITDTTSRVSVFLTKNSPFYNSFDWTLTFACSQIAESVVQLTSEEVVQLTLEEKTRLHLPDGALYRVARCASVSALDCLLPQI